MLVLSHVLPFPGDSGQQQRVANTLRALRNCFHVTFLTYAAPARQREQQTQLAVWCDDPVCLVAQTQAHPLKRLWHGARSRAYAALTGLKTSNYHIGQVEFAPHRLQRWLQGLDGKQFDLALYEYWHAAPSIPTLQAHGIRCVLDMHDILWQTYQRQLMGETGTLSAAGERRLARYRQREERAWQQFDALIAINHAELDYVRERARPAQKLFHAAMGVALDDWPYAWQPVAPPRLAYYGALGNAHNQRDALVCVREIMPYVWQQIPTAELWLVGSNPPESLRALSTQDSRIHVTGFVKDAADVLKTMTAVLCPWKGTFGFRSRLIEAMAVGTPVIASPDAVYGMKMEIERGLWLADTPAEFAQCALRLLQDQALAQVQSRAAREQAKRRFSLPATYGTLTEELYAWCVGQAGASPHQ
jgi:glycosyltransferase involved in cell wall biosynthesis